MKIKNFFRKINIFKKLNFKSSVTLFTSGYNLERYLNDLCTRNISFLSVEKLNTKNAKIEVSPIYEREVEQFLKGKSVEITDKKYNGFFKLQKFFFSRFGLLVGLFFAFCFSIIASNYVWKIEIMGNVTHSSDEIITILNDNDVNIFDFLNKKTNEEIERIILDNFGEVSMVSVIKKGTSIIVNIKEKILSNEQETYFPLIATNDGIITKIELIQGTLLVKPGDIIRAGDALVAPYIIDSSGNQSSIEPKANVYADIWLSGESIHYDIKNFIERTGNSYRERRVIFLNREIYKEKSNVNFNNYETEIVETYLSETLLPIKYQTIYFYETVSRIIEQPFDQVKDIRIAEAKGLAMLRMREGEEIKSENHVLTSTFGKTVISYSITVNRKIS